MIFNKKVTLFLNSNVSDNMVEDMMTQLGNAVEANGYAEEWQVESEQGSYERFCNCGSADCSDAEAAYEGEAAYAREFTRILAELDNAQA